MNPQKQILPSREALTAFQIQNCLSIVQATGSFLVQPDIDAENPHKPGGSMDGGPRAAAEMTFVKACEKLDAILEDKPRWGLEIQRLLETQLVRMLAEQTSFYRAQTAASQTLVLPHVQYHANLAKAPDGVWVAFIGPINKPTVFGIGTTPELAMTDFDASFRGEVTESQLKYLSENPNTKTRKKKK